MRPLRWALIQHERCPRKKGKSRHKQTQRENVVKTLGKPLMKTEDWSNGCGAKESLRSQKLGDRPGTNPSLVPSEGT